MIPLQFALRRRMMMAGGGVFEFTYTGQFTDKIEGSKRVIKLTSSGTLNVSGSVVADVYLLAGGGGSQYGDEYAGGGGGGGNQTLTKLRIAEGSYSISIGKGGNAGSSSNDYMTYCAQTGGSTSGFGHTVTGGGGGCTLQYGGARGGAGGSPNGIAGSTSGGGSPNGGWRRKGGDGYITLTIPI